MLCAKQQLNKTLRKIKKNKKIQILFLYKEKKNV